MLIYKYSNLLRQGIVVDRLEILEKKIAKLNAQKQRLTALSKTKNSKLLVKQKILIGAYMMSKSIPQMEQNKRLSFLNAVKSKIPDSRKSDLHALNELLRFYGDNNE